MGNTYTPAIISNLADRNKAWQGDFLIDAGAIDSLVPRDYTRCNRRQAQNTDESALSWQTEEKL